jgi:hypothetical protein
MRQWLRLSICTLAVGCINTNVQHLDDAPRLARSPDSVRVLHEEPQQPYKELAVRRRGSGVAMPVLGWHLQQT